MTLKQLKESIQDKNKIEKKIQEFEKETSKLQRESSVLSQQLEEETLYLNKLEKKIFLFNKHNKCLEVEEKVRKLNSKLRSNNYQLNLYQIDLEKLNKQYNEVRNSEIKYEEELNYQIKLLNHSEYNQTLNDIQLYKVIILEAEPLMDCLKKMDLYYRRGNNYSIIEKKYILGSSMWFLGTPSVDIPKLKKEIVRFEELLKRLNIFQEEIELYFKYSKEFFENVLLLDTLVRNDLYSMKIIDFKRDISNITNKIRKRYEEMIQKEIELKKELEEMILKK